MKGPLARILLRYASAALVTWGVISPPVGNALASDPDMVALVGFGIGLAVEGYYWLAKRYDWPT